MNDLPLPVPGCWVRDREESRADWLGIVRMTISHDNDPKAKVEWLKPDRRQSIVPISQLSCGFRLGTEVLEAGGAGRGSLGFGAIIGLRKLGNREQVLVDFPETGKRAWLPYQNLRQVKGPRHRFITGDTGDKDSPERFRLKLLAHALEIWNENTGALSHLDIDPLPHQIHLVHHLLSSGNLNWLIADDVGLGKTIETGMLLAALQQRELLGRVLLITPAGLTKQWKDELYYKFGFEDFEIYGEDFFINEPRQWKMHDFVIGSMDKLKQETDLSSLLRAPDWDLIIVDEGHRLSRRQYGMRYDYSGRFQMAQVLRGRTRSIILLTATPHQGMHDKFVALLELLRPELKEELQTLTLNPEIMSEMIYRNYKADVTDAEGNFVFKGKQTRSIRVQSSEQALIFDRALQKYLQRGYSAGGNTGGTAGRAIGFVMTIYRKLAASSAAAILNALRRRGERLIIENDRQAEDLAADERYAGEWEEQQEAAGREFFEGELALLDELIQRAGHLKQHDQKLRGFCDQIIGQILLSNPHEKILIFTEYRSTQDYLQGTLQERYGKHCVDLINGSMDHEARRQAIQHFEADGQFLISTEAGGEGINLQRRCHVMVNYDLPWNPMRLVQRVGRLYRYGQEKPVVVFNLHAIGTVDEDIIELMYQRLNAVVTDLAAVERHEFNERLADDVLGEVAELLDVGDILAAATQSGIQRTQQRINEALKMARGAAQKQRELFEHAARYDEEDLAEDLQITDQHVQAFVLGMFKVLGIEIIETRHNDKVLKIRLPDAARDELGMKASRMDITFDRLMVANRPNTVMMDLTVPLMIYLMQIAKSYDFGGQSAVVKGLTGEAILAALLRWQDDQGRRIRQSLSIFKLDGKSVETNAAEFGAWLLREAASGYANAARERNEVLMKLAEDAANKALAAASNRYLHPENLQWLAGSWFAASE